MVIYQLIAICPLRLAACGYILIDCSLSLEAGRMWLHTDTGFCYVSWLLVVSVVVMLLLLF